MAKILQFPTSQSIEVVHLEEIDAKRRNSRNDKIRRDYKDVMGEIKDLVTVDGWKSETYVVMRVPYEPELYVYQRVDYNWNPTWNLHFYADIVGFVTFDPYSDVDGRIMWSSFPGVDDLSTEEQMKHAIAAGNAFEEACERQLRDEAMYRALVVGDKMTNDELDPATEYTVVAVKGDFVTLQRGNEKPVRRKVKSHAVFIGVHHAHPKTLVHERITPPGAMPVHHRSPTQRPDTLLRGQGVRVFRRLKDGNYRIRRCTHTPDRLPITFFMLRSGGAAS